MKPRVYHLGLIKKAPIIIDPDAEWTVLTDHPGLKKGLGGILWQKDSFPLAAALDTPQRLVDALSPRVTQIILLELMAAAGMLETYGHLLRGEDVPVGDLWTLAER